MSNRRTGRTTRMLEAAVAEARKGKYVIVVAANQTQAKLLQQQVASITGGKSHATNVEVDGGSITFESPSSTHFDWPTLTVRGAFPGIPTFVDHFAIETTYARILSELHRWDK